MHPELRASLGDRPGDALVPELVRSALPSGLRGLVLAGLIAAAMSSLDSSLNALSASSARDFGGARNSTLRGARLWTLAWGALITAFAFVVGDISATVIEAINKVGSAVYGPVLAVFALARLVKRPAPLAVLAGLSLGFGANLALWLFAPSVHFLWWNVVGCGVALAGALLFGAAWGFQPLDATATLRASDDALTATSVLGWLGAALTMILGVMALLEFAAG